MGASPDHPSRRLRSKAAGDAAVRQAVPSATIFKPGPIMGDEDDFLNNLLFQVGCDVQDMAVQYSAVQYKASPPLGCAQCHYLQAWTHHG
jgi:hypothetical protein